MILGKIEGVHKRKVLLTWEAIYDVIEITDYLESNFGKARADQFQEDIKMQMRKLEYMGGIFGMTYILYRNHTIYKKPFPPSIIFYIIKEPANEIHVLRVLREERDWSTILIQNQKYTYPD